MAKGNGNNGGGKFMDNGRGMCAYSDNPMPAPSETSSRCGPGMNADQRKADKLLQQATKKNESLRGLSGM